MIMLIIYIILLLSAHFDGRSIYVKKIKVNDGEQRQLIDNIF